MTMQRKLLKLEDGEYTDQYGFTHKCKKVIDDVILTLTDEVHSCEHCNETINDRIYIDPQSRKFRCHSPTDFGCGTAWRELGVQRVTGQTWAELRPRNEGKPMYYAGTYPIIDDRGPFFTDKKFRNMR